MLAKLTRAVRWIAVLTAVSTGGAALGGFLIAWIRTPSNGSTLFFEGKKCLETVSAFFPFGGGLLHFWETHPVLNNLTAFFPGFFWGGVLSVSLWFLLALSASWQNCLLFSRTGVRLGVMFVPLLVYVGLFAIQVHPDRNVRLRWALLPFALTVLLGGAVLRNTRRSCLPEPNSAPPDSGPWDFLATGLVWVAALDRAWDWLEVALMRHNHFFSQAYDTGLMGHILNNLVTGQGLTSSLIVSGGSFLGHHFSPILFLFAPFYFFCPHPELLILFQTLAVALAAVPLYHFSRKFLESTWTAVAVAGIYLYLPGISEGVYADVHTIAFVPLLLFWLAYEALNGKSRRMGIALALLLMVQENVFLYVLALGVFLLCYQDLRQKGRILVGCALLAGFLVFVVFQPLFRPAGELGYGFVHRYRDFVDDPGPGRAGVLRLLAGIASHPGAFFSRAFGSDSLEIYEKFWKGIWFAPLWNPKGWFFLLPCLENTLSSEDHLHLWKGHYGFGPAALSSLAMVAGLKMLYGWSFFALRKIQIAWILFFSQVLWALKHALLPFSMFMMSVYFSDPLDSSATLKTLYQTIPPQGEVAALSYLVPHLTHHRKLHLLPPGNPRYVGSEPLEPDEEPAFEDLEPDVGWPEYMVFNPEVRPGVSWYNAWFYSKEKTLDWLTWLEETGRYEKQFPIAGFSENPETSVVILRRIDAER